MVWSNTPELKSGSNGMEVSTYLASRYVIDQNSVKLFYSENGISYNEAQMTLAESNEDGNNSGKYFCIINNINSTGILKYYFSAKNFNGESSVYPSGAPKNYLESSGK
jgi:hypothetical protein